jgi:hypothetical protein
VIKGPEGIVLAAESRITLTSQAATGEKLLVSYDNAQKVFSFSLPHKFIGAVTYGVGGIGQRSAPSYLPEFELSLKETGRLTVKDFANKLSSFYLQQWRSTMPEDYKGPPLVFIVAGYDSGEPYGRVYAIEIPKASEPKEVYADVFGIVWGGQREIVDRLLAGYDGRVLQVAKETLTLNDDQVAKLREALQRFGMALPIEILPLQDCIDLAIFFIRTTIEAQKLTVSIRGVGGPIDVATITRTDGLKWIQRKQLRGEIPTTFLPTEVS